MRLRPGENRITFRYQQSMRFFESLTRYGPPLYQRAECGMDYLLYPAKSWTPSPDFVWKLRVEVPYLVDPGWFWDDHWAPVLQSNLRLRKSPQSSPRRTVFTGTYREFDTDILSLRITWKER